MISHQHSEPQSPSRVVVLGASGFVGREAVKHLSGLDIETVGLSSSDIDLCSPDAVGLLEQSVRQEDALVIVSALTPDKGKDVRTLMRNLSMGEHLSAYLQKSPCSHIVYISSDAVYSDSVSLVRETSCASPTSFHGLMHLVREEMLKSAVKASGVPLVILRPCAIYGSGDTHNGYGPNRFLRSAIKEGRIILFGQGEEKRDHLYIEDLARLVGFCLTYQSQGILNVASGSSVSFAEVARIVANSCERKVHIEGLTRQSPVTHRHFDITELITAFPKVCLTSIADGLSKTFNLMAEAELVRG